MCTNFRLPQNPCFCIGAVIASYFTKYERITFSITKPKRKKELLRKLKYSIEPYPKNNYEP